MKNKGISLIVLIITCVVIIILATAIIVNIAQTNMIENAKEAVVKQDFKTMQDELTMYKSDKFVETRGDFKAEDLDIKKKEDIAEIMPSIVDTKYEAYVLIEDGCIAISDEMPEKERTWAMEALGLVKTSTNRPTEPEVDTVSPTEPTNLELTVKGNVITAKASGSTDDNDFIYEYSINNTTWQESEQIKDLDNQKEYTVYARSKDNAGNVSNTINKTIETKYKINNVNTIVENINATIYGELPSYNNPVIPVGFKAIETTDATWEDTNSDGLPDGWNNGLVIADNNKNEFVWVPCTTNGANGTIRYTKNLNYPSEYSATSENTSDDANALPNGITNQTAQITKYGGFYIGRYEAGVPGKTGTPSNYAGKPTVQQGATVWTDIDYTNSNASAKSFINTANVKSGLVTGTGWDTVCAWINSEINDDETPIHSVTNSTSWGNYSDDPVDGDNGKKTAGFKEEWKAKNIYDLAGNTWEWTGESYSTYRINRGGRYSISGSSYPASYRNYRNYSDTYDFISFRIALYVM